RGAGGVVRRHDRGRGRAIGPGAPRRPGEHDGLDRPDEDPLPPTTPRRPRLERVLAWLAPRWAARRAAVRAARHRHAIAQRLADVADTRRQAHHGPHADWLRPPVRHVGGYRIPADAARTRSRPGPPPPPARPFSGPSA